MHDPALWAGPGAALRDPDTGLATRALLLDRLKHALQRQRRTRALFAVLALVPEGMREMRAELAPAARAALLETVAARIQQAIRDSDTVASPSGSGFMVLLDPISSLADASFVADRIQRAVEAPLEVEGRTLVLTVRIGIVLADESYTHPLDLVRDAHAALGGIQLAARSHYRVFDPSLHAVTTPDLGAELGRALEEHQLTVEYQPIARVADGVTVAFNAVARWDHPRLGALGPERFMGAAEDAGLASRVEQWLLTSVCAEAASWPRERAGETTRVLVRISGRRFRNPTLPEEVWTVLGRTGLDPARLALTVTESVLMETGKPALEVLQQLHALGISLCIDNFGMGYFTFGHLHRFPVDLLRVESSFVGGLGVYDENEGVVRATAALARALGAEAIAAGAETAEQVELLRTMECRYAQGPAISAPLDAAAAAARLAAG